MTSILKAELEDTRQVKRALHHEIDQEMIYEKGFSAQPCVPTLAIKWFEEKMDTSPV